MAMGAILLGALLCALPSCPGIHGPGTVAWAEASPALRLRIPLAAPAPRCAAGSRFPGLGVGCWRLRGGSDPEGPEEKGKDEAAAASQGGSEQGSAEGDAFDGMREYDDDLSMQSSGDGIGGVGTGLHNDPADSDSSEGASAGRTDGKEPDGSTSAEMNERVRELMDEQASDAGSAPSLDPSQRQKKKKSVLKGLWAEDDVTIEEVLDEQQYPGLTTRCGEYFEPAFPGDTDWAHGEPVTPVEVEGVLKTVHSNATQNEKKLWIAVSGGNIDKARELLDIGTNPNKEDKWQMTPLHWAAARGHTAIVELLLERGAMDSLEARAEWEGTPLHSACEWGRYDVVKILIDAGADIEAVDVNEQTPLHIATHLPTQEMLGDGDARRTVKLLLDAGAKVFVKDVAGNTPRDYCSDYPPYCAQNLTRLIYPPEESDEREYYAKRGPPAGITRVLGPDGMEPEEAEGLPMQWPDVAKAGVPLRRSFPFTPSPSPEVEDLGYEMQQQHVKDSEEDSMGPGSSGIGRRKRDQLEAELWGGDEAQRQEIRDFGWMKNDDDEDVPPTLLGTQRRGLEDGELEERVEERGASPDENHWGQDSAGDDIRATFAKTLEGKTDVNELFKHLPDVPRAAPKNNALTSASSVTELLENIPSLDQLRAMEGEETASVTREDTASGASLREDTGSGTD